MSRWLAYKLTAVGFEVRVPPRVSQLVNVAELPEYAWMRSLDGPRANTSMRPCAQLTTVGSLVSATPLPAGSQGDQAEPFQYLCIK